MIDPIHQEQSAAVVMIKRAFGLWPYLFIVISVTGLTYLAINAAR